MPVKTHSLINYYGGHPETVFRARRFRVHPHRQATELLGVVGKDAPLTGDEFTDALHLSASDGSLHIGHLVFEAHHFRPKLPGLAERPAMVAEGQHFLVQPIILGDKHSPLAGGHRLRAVKREGAECTHRPCATPMPPRTDRLRRIFDDVDAVLAA